MSQATRVALASFNSTAADRTIATTRTALAMFSLFAIWLDPAVPARYAEVTYSLHSAYVLYSAIIAALVWSRMRLGWLPLSTHIADLIIFSVFQYLTAGPSSPFFMYFVFALFSAALRWGWTGTLLTAPVVLASFVVDSPYYVGLSMT